MGDRQQAEVGDVELLVQDGEDDRQLAYGDDLGGELELFIQGGVDDGQLAGGGEL